jgi:hypothetical protein
VSDSVAKLQARRPMDYPPTRGGRVPPTNSPDGTLGVVAPTWSGSGNNPNGRVSRRPVDGPAIPLIAGEHATRSWRLRCGFGRLHEDLPQRGQVKLTPVNRA